MNLYSAHYINFKNSSNYQQQGYENYIKQYKMRFNHYYVHLNVQHYFQFPAITRGRLESLYFKYFYRSNGVVTAIRCARISKDRAENGRGDF